VPNYKCLSVQEYVSHERLDGEVIAIDTRSGAFFNFGQSAADCWTLLVNCYPIENWSAILNLKYGSGPFDGINEFVQNCLEYELVKIVNPQNCNVPINMSASALPDDHTRTIWETPEIMRFDDLQDLIKIDPIHDTSTFGWPSVASDG
jgi:hypothetical protein